MIKQPECLFLMILSELIRPNIKPDPRNFMYRQVFDEMLLQGHDIRFPAYGRSMAPFVSSGDRVIIRRMPISRLIRGDLVLCRVEGGGVVLHRLLRIRHVKGPGPVLFTKGDALDIPDAKVPASDYLGKAVAIEGANGRIRRLDLSSARCANYIRALYQISRSALVRGSLRVKRSVPFGRAAIPGMTCKSHRYLYDLISGRCGPETGFPDWDAVVAAACDEHVQGLLYIRLKDALVPEPVRRHLEAAYYATAAGNIFRMNTLRDIDRVMSREGLSAMVIKGALLLHEAYEDPGLRPMEDIDLLVRPEQADRVRSALQGAGFRPDDDFGQMLRANGIVIDLHTHLLHADRIAGREDLFRIDPWACATPLGPEFSAIFKPDPADHILFLAHHLIKHSFSRLIWLVDLHRLLESADESMWRRISEKAVLFGQERPLACACYLLQTIFGYRHPLFHASLLQRLSVPERFILNLKYRRGDVGDLGNLLWFFWLPDWRGRIRFILRLLFPKDSPDSGSFRRNRLRRIGSRLHRSAAAGLAGLKR